MMITLKKHSAWQIPIVLLAVLGLLAVANGLMALMGTTPPIEIKKGEVNIVSAPAEPEAKSLCPDTWSYTAVRDEHTRVVSCTKESWIVILQEDGSPSHAYQKNTPGAQFVFPGQPGWSAVEWPK